MTPLPGLRLIDSPRSREIQLGFLDRDTGVRKGLKSSVYGISLKDNPDKARGARGKLIHYEEDGLFPKLEKAWSVNRKAVEDGDMVYGRMVAMGTGGTEGADFEGSEKLFRNPLAYNIYGIPNVFDKNSNGESLCGFFWGAYLNRAECYDVVNGEPDVIKALVDILQDRFTVKYNSSDPAVITQKLAEEPIVVSEAVMRTGGTIFPVADLKDYRDSIRIQGARYFDAHYVGDLVMNQHNIEWKPNADLYPIRRFPVGSDKPEGAIEIFEMPKYNADGKIDPNRYISGCLTPGEKVMTDKGFMNVEDVTYEEKLINESGKLVDVKALLRYDKTDEDVFTIKVANTFRKTTFTKEHPILVSKHKLGYVSKKKYQRLGIKQRYHKFDFKYTTAENVVVGDWTKVPNIYKNKNDFDISLKWSYSDDKINNPIFNEDFWWIIGLWIGDGWCDDKKKNITIVFNEKEEQYIDRYSDAVSKIFGKKINYRFRNGAVECSFISRHFNDFLNSNFSRYSYGKYIPEWAKRIDSNLKYQFILGYLNSDGCITKNDSKYYCAEFVSINQELLESVQDILFSIGIVSSLSLLRGESTRYLNNILCDTKKTYHLRIFHTETLKLVSLINRNDDIKISKIDFDNLPELRAKDITIGCFFDDTEDYIYFKITEIENNKYTGIVYNFECETHTFMCNHITTHNCDPVDDDYSGTTSLTSIFIYDLYTDRIVAEFTGRPKFANDFYEICRRMLIFYHATLNYENNRKGLFTYFDQKRCLHLLCDTPQILRDMDYVKGSGYGNKAKGCNATAQINTWGRRLQRDWLMSPAYMQDVDEDGNQVGQKLNMHCIRSIAYIEELIGWNPDGNFDRISAMGMLMIYREDRLKYIHQRDNKITDDDYDEYIEKNFANAYQGQNSYHDW